MKRTYSILTIAAGLAFIAMVPLLGGCKGHVLDDTELSIAEAGAGERARNSNSDLIACKRDDSDGDKHVTCTLKDRKPPHEEREINCSYVARGCKFK